MKNMKQIFKKYQKYFITGVLFLIVLFIVGNKLTTKETSIKKTIVAHTSMSTVVPKKTTLPKKEVLPGNKSDWKLQLVNRDHPIKKEPTNLAEIDDAKVDSRIVTALQEMKQAAKKEQIDFIVASGYRSVAQQKELFQASINEALKKGMTPEKAKEEALRYRTEPGTSEHHTGLACDIIDASWEKENGNLIPEYGKSKGGQWLEKHAESFGFIIRYPQHKKNQTFVEYEPWHLRYVGVENAKYMNQHQLCLEEYYHLLEKQ